MYSLPSDCCVMAMVDDKAHKDIHMKGLQPRYGSANDVRKKGKRGAFAWDMADPDARQSLPSRRRAQTVSSFQEAGTNDDHPSHCCFVFCRFMDQGKFVPDQIIFEVLVAAVERAKGQGKHILLDGFPRWGMLFFRVLCSCGCLCREHRPRCAGPAVLTDSLVLQQPVCFGWRGIGRVVALFSG